MEGYQVVDTNSEIAEYSDIVIQCAKDPEPGTIVWKVTRAQGGPTETICARAPADNECLAGLQSPYYNKRVTKVTRTSIRVSSVFLNETGTYQCREGFNDYQTYTNVRIVSKFAT